MIVQVSTGNLTAFEAANARQNQDREPAAAAVDGGRHQQQQMVKTGQDSVVSKEACAKVVSGGTSNSTEGSIFGTAVVVTASVQESEFLQNAGKDFLDF